MPDIYWIPNESAGRLGICPHPEGGAALAGEIDSLRANGVGRLVSLLTTEEMRTLALEDEGPLCEENGLVFQRFAVTDRGVPTDVCAFADLVDEVGAALDAGENVVAHCWGGVGRSGLLACALLCRRGVSPAAASASVSRHRGVASPETSAQQQFLSTHFA